MKVSFSADSLLPSGQEGLDIHSSGQRHARRWSDQFREAAHDRQGSALAVSHVLGSLRLVHDAAAGRAAAISRHDCHESTNDRYVVIDPHDQLPRPKA